MNFARDCERGAQGAYAESCFSLQFGNEARLRQSSSAEFTATTVGARARFDADCATKMSAGFLGA
ncbi:hypothetical protein [Bradyrhizobium australiense]|uniref:Uncharacterized protein n=1 Tax=Bradyrhizobium australiense TaxID=2721161 RepID=A0A7Y4LYW1_9BRAD|nr:hypothetical protein [Bradyrhizobium australiense]NOJ43170.1 hypothetical protein [Bradyrhizobium australiense]